MLTIELVPHGAWFKNLRSELSKEEWDIIRKRTYRNAGYKCEICGGKGKKWPVECHEMWEYDDINKIQTLTGTIALCPSCHEVKHIGLAQVKGNINRAIAHLTKVNSWDKQTAITYINNCIDEWERRSCYSWDFDISLVTKIKCVDKYF